MTLLRIEQLDLENFRGFDRVCVTFEPDMTVFFAENGGGKTAALTSLAMALDLLQPRPTRGLILDVERDARRIRGAGGQREPAGPCTIECSAAIGSRSDIKWSMTASATSRRQKREVAAASEAIEEVRQPGDRWPLLGLYGTGRFASERKSRRKAGNFLDRWDGYAGCLDPYPTDGPLLDWLKAEVLGDFMRHRQNEAERRLDLAVLGAIQRATPGIAEISYDPAAEGPVARFVDGTEATWFELSDGFYMFMALVGDIARRAMILNSQDGSEAPILVEGVVLIDEVDLHLHPRWQRTVLDGLRKAFPKLQFIVTTHSPQVLSSIKNHQVRRFANWQVREQGVHVEGRDTNAILRDLMGTDDRDERGAHALSELHDLIDDGKVREAWELFAELKEKWGTMDPALIRAQGLLDEIGAEGGT